MKSRITYPVIRANVDQDTDVGMQQTCHKGPRVNEAVVYGLEITANAIAASLKLGRYSRCQYVCNCRATKHSCTRSTRIRSAMMGTYYPEQHQRHREHDRG